MSAFSQLASGQWRVQVRCGGTCATPCTFAISLIAGKSEVPSASSSLIDDLGRAQVSSPEAFRRVVPRVAASRAVVVVCVAEQTRPPVGDEHYPFVLCGQRREIRHVPVLRDSAVPESESSGWATQEVRCPRCNGSVDRIRRRLADRIVSLFTPVRRYRCWNYDCKWEGNLRRQESIASRSRSDPMRAKS
jgi:hypothetical protein